MPDKNGEAEKKDEQINEKVSDFLLGWACGVVSTQRKIDMYVIANSNFNKKRIRKKKMVENIEFDVEFANYVRLCLFSFSISEKFAKDSNEH